VVHALKGSVRSITFVYAERKGCQPCLYLRPDFVKAHDFLTIFKADSVVQTLAEGIRTSGALKIRVKGIHGSLDAVLFAALYKSVRASHLLIAQNKEEAA